MRRLLLCTTAAIHFTAGFGIAGGVTEPVMEPEVVAAATSSSAGGVVVPLLLLLVVAAALSAGGGEPPSPSDARLKTDVVRVGTTHLGLPLYHFRYIGDEAVYEGVMAQDVAVMHPNAVRTLPLGYLAVDYAKLGLKMRRVH
jgi:hypothetical protein